MNNVTTTALPTHCTRCRLPFWADEPRAEYGYQHYPSRCAARLLDEVTRLRTALRSFANRANWTSDGVWNAMDDPWEVARQALEAQP